VDFPLYLPFVGVKAVLFPLPPPPLSQPHHPFPSLDTDPLSFPLFVCITTEVYPFFPTRWAPPHERRGESFLFLFGLHVVPPLPPFCHVRSSSGFLMAHAGTFSFVSHRVSTRWKMLFSLLFSATFSPSPDKTPAPCSRFAPSPFFFMLVIGPHRLSHAMRERLLSLSTEEARSAFVTSGVKEGNPGSIFPLARSESFRWRGETFFQRFSSVLFFFFSLRVVAGFLSSR